MPHGVYVGTITLEDPILGESAVLDVSSCWYNSVPLLNAQKAVMRVSCFLLAVIIIKLPVTAAH